MPVVIRDFEVIVEPPHQRPSEQSTSQPTQSNALRPVDIDRIVKHFKERRARVHAN